MTRVIYDTLEFPGEPTDGRITRVDLVAQVLRDPSEIQYGVQVYMLYRTWRKNWATDRLMYELEDYDFAHQLFDDASLSKTHMDSDPWFLYIKGTAL